MRLSPQSVQKIRNCVCVCGREQGDPSSHSVMAAIVIALTSYAYIVAPNPPVSSSVHRGGAVVANLFGGVRWPWEDGEASDEAGKFVRHSELSPGAAPLGAVVCGFDDDSLEALGEAIEGVYDNADGEPIAHVPIAVLAQGDLRLPLRRILSELNNRDSILPDSPCSPTCRWCCCRDSQLLP